MFGVFSKYARKALVSENKPLKFILKVVPGGGLEPPTRRFLVAIVLDYYSITMSYKIINKVCAKCVFINSCDLEEPLCLEQMAKRNFMLSYLPFFHIVNGLSYSN